ncbi:MAG: hypothetical protein ABIL09_27890 [Gemmatimonadota bacterium]
MKDHAAKPIDPEALLAAVMRWIARRESEVGRVGDAGGQIR